jgi:tRNA1(Val) A37 N6-methylase TrmN6
MTKYIEKDFPFADLSLIAERESWRKEVYRPVYYIHKWWAKRLGSVFRGILLGACLDETDDFWECYYKKNEFNSTTVVDPFMGSGVTLGEAIKLGCKVIGRDINPVSFLSCNASLSKYKPSEVLSVYKDIENRVSSTLLEYYKTKTDQGEDAVVLYYFLVKELGCPKCGKNIELFKTRIFSKNAMPRKDPTAKSLCPFCGAINHTLYNSEEVFCDKCSKTYNPQEGAVRGPNVKCGSCEHVFKLVDQMQNVDGPLGYRRYAKMILSNGGNKSYCKMNSFDHNLEKKIASKFNETLKLFPKISIEPGYNTNQSLKHNYRYWHEFFSDRQLICISHLVDAISDIHPPELKLLFACLFSGVLEFNNLFASFKGEGTGAVRHMFSHHVLKPELMPIEANIWGTSKSSGSFSTLFKSRILKALEYKANPSEIRIVSGKSAKVGRINNQINTNPTYSYNDFITGNRNVYISQGDSSCTEIKDSSIDLVITDPPFFDNVHYSQLADFFYYWLNQILNFSDNKTTRSKKEVQDTSAEHFTKKLGSVFAECNRILKKNGLFIFTYHHSRHEGWTAIHRAIRHSGFVCQQVYPIKAEMSVSMPLLQAKSPIHLDLIIVCKNDDKNSINKILDTDPIITVIDEAKNIISSLKANKIKVSLGDTKVILMGKFLCEAHRMRSLENEENFLIKIEQDIDQYVYDALKAEGEVLYKMPEPQQLSLFEKLEKYLANKANSADAKSRAAD